MLIQIINLLNINEILIKKLALFGLVSEFEEVEWDYIIVGAGIFGCVTARYLKESLPEAKILLIDKFLAAGQGNSSKSNACYRNVFDTDLNILLSSSSVGYYKYLEKKEKIDLGIKEFGYLWLLTDDQYQARHEKSIPYQFNEINKKVSLIEFMELNNIPIEIYTHEQLVNMFPVLKTAFNAAEKDDNEFGMQIRDIQYGLLGKQCGTLEPDLLVKAYEQFYKNLGGEVLYNHEVVKLILKEKGEAFDPDYIPTVWRNSEIAGIKVQNEAKNEILTIKAKNVVLTTGAWINQLLDELGVNSTVKAKKRQLFRICGVDKLVDNQHFNDLASIPFLILPIGGVFIKPVPEAKCVDVGCADDIARRFETRAILGKDEYDIKSKFLDDPHGEVDFYLYNVLPVLEMYFPTVFTDDTKLAEKPSAGMYSYTVDKFPVIEKVKSLGNLFFCSGGSGSGIMKADSFGRILVSQILGQTKCKLFNGFEVNVEDFSIHDRNLPKETLVL
ncbi:MAG: NAD(P)/FAD-dependent oxidoreductase [Candidatus Kariarchaeaceae archaeon]|jgi:glycine/D-amino acid oxidase-like deaminating enzyme